MEVRVYEVNYGEFFEANVYCDGVKDVDPNEIGSGYLITGATVVLSKIERVYDKFLWFTLGSYQYKNTKTHDQLMKIIFKNGRTLNVSKSDYDTLMARKSP